MPLYISLQKYTDQGIKDVKGTPERLEKAMKGAEAMGCKIIGYYAVMGEYDAVAIGIGRPVDVHDHCQTGIHAVDDVPLDLVVGIGARAGREGDQY